MALSSVASATDPGAPSGDGVDPVFIEGNPSCATLNANASFTGITSDFGFKIDGSPNGTYTLTNPPGTLTGGAPSDPSNSITISNSDGKLFDWLATLGIDAVIVKGGPNADAFVYNPEDTADTELHAPINPQNGEYYGISHIEFCYDYSLTASKTANAQYKRTYTWTIDKSVDDDSHTGFAGDQFTSNYDVVVDQTTADSDFAVAGVITVNNPTPFEVTFSVTDSVGGTPATPTCVTNTLAAGASTTCSYSASLGAKTDGTNTATVTVTSPSGVGGATATAGYTFGDPTSTAGYPTVNVTDTVEGALGSASGDTTFEYPDTFTCPTDPKEYTDGKYEKSFPNTAEITETKQSDSENVDLTCYIPSITKTADTATYDQFYEWDVDKTVAPESQSGYPGDKLEWEWKVSVTKTALAAENGLVSGTITVVNPHPTLAMTVALTDVLSDGATGTISADADCDFDGTNLEVPAASSATCDYSAESDTKPAENIATAKLNGVDFEAKAGITWVAEDQNATAELTDDQGPLDEDLSGDGPWEFKYTDDHTCSSLKSAYGADGTYSASIENTAIVKSGSIEQDRSSATTRYTCSAGFVDLLKLTEGLVDPSQSWSFALYLGPDGFDGNPKVVIGTGNTNGDADGVLEFGSPALNPTKTYTICELAVPAGWTSFWQVDTGSGFGTVNPYNPDADNAPAEDVGNRCVDFGAGTTIAITVGDTVHFKVDNTFPGGAPRTPGYWKNWNRCTGGNQAQTAAANGGWQEGFWLLEDVLTPSIGGGIVWDDNGNLPNNDSGTTYPITTCDQAVKILDKRNTTTGQKKASDPLHNLAAHLLAAQLNFGAGACTTQPVLDAALAAERLLDKYNFVGSYSGSVSKADATLANSLASYLDQYNNGAFCGS